MGMRCARPDRARQGHHNGELEPDGGEVFGGGGEQGSGGLRSDGEGGDLVGHGLREARGIGGPIPRALTAREAPAETSSKPVMTESEGAIDVDQIGGVGGLGAPQLRKAGAGIANGGDEVALDAVALGDGVLAHCERLVELVPTGEQFSADRNGRVSNRTGMHSRRGAAEECEKRAASGQRRQAVASSHVQ